MLTSEMMDELQAIVDEGRSEINFGDRHNLRAALDTLRKQEWRPIAEWDQDFPGAPFSHHAILCSIRSGWLRVGVRCQSTGRWYSGNYAEPKEAPTHFMPLPEMPFSKATSAARSEGGG